MNTLSRRSDVGLAAVLTALLGGYGGVAEAFHDIDGINGPSFDLTASSGSVSVPDGTSLTSWGYGVNGTMQYPGPTLIVNQGDTVTVTLTNNLPVRTSIVFPGQEGVTASGGAAGIITNEACVTGEACPNTVSYSFVATRPGTFMYHSGSHLDLQVEMGLVGAVIVRPAGYHPVNNRTAYGVPGTEFEHDHMFLLTEMDPYIHFDVAARVAQGQPLDDVDTTGYFPVLWFINGRAAPDTLVAPGLNILPHQPYDSMVRAHPGERVLMRVIGAGRDLHPFHHHGNNAIVIARDGALLRSGNSGGPDLAFSDFTIQSQPGVTYDALFRWTGRQLGWDVYGAGAGFEHDCIDAVNNETGAGPADSQDDETWEWCPDHNKPLPVEIPGNQDLTFGAWYSGSPFLGSAGTLPPGEGGLNPNNGLFFMWHSHTEKELTNFDIFPGGMFTMYVVEPHWAPIP